MTLSHCDQEPPPIPTSPTSPSRVTMFVVCHPRVPLEGKPALIPQTQTRDELPPSHPSAEHLAQWAARQGLSQVSPHVGSRAQARAGHFPCHS